MDCQDVSNAFQIQTLMQWIILAEVILHLWKCLCSDKHLGTELQDQRVSVYMMMMDRGYYFQRSNTNFKSPNNDIEDYPIPYSLTNYLQHRPVLKGH